MSDKPWWIPSDGFDDMPEPTGDDQRDFENQAEYFEYSLQCAFEDLCGHIGFNRATGSVMRILREHMEMLKRQGRH